MCIAIVCFVLITRELCLNILSMVLTLNYQIRMSLERVYTTDYKQMTYMSTLAED